MIARRSVVLGAAMGAPVGAPVSLAGQQAGNTASVAAAITAAVTIPDGRVWKAAEERWAAPGSTIKPMILVAMKQRGKARCHRELHIAGHNLTCTHLPVEGLLDAETALAASCNCWFAAMAHQVDARVLESTLRGFGAQVTAAGSVEELQLQVLGVERVRFTPLRLARAYSRLAGLNDAAIQAGLRKAIEFGTGQLASVKGMAIAGKTGTTQGGAWFAGYAPAGKPEVAVAVFVRQGTGGADAAPAAGEVFAEWHRRTASH